MYNHLILLRSIDHAESSKYGKGCSLAYVSLLRPLVSLGSHLDSATQTRQVVRT